MGTTVIIRYVIYLGSYIWLLFISYLLLNQIVLKFKTIDEQYE